VLCDPMMTSLFKMTSTRLGNLDRGVTNIVLLSHVCGTHIVHCRTDGLRGIPRQAAF
jgi:hypothetical protein